MEIKRNSFIYLLIGILLLSLTSAFNFGDTAPSTTNTIVLLNGSIVEHNNLTGLQGGTTNEYYHVRESWYNTLTSNIDDWITNAVSDLVNYYTITEINANNASWSSTFNSTYNTWAYNQTTPAIDYADGLVTINNASWSSTFNSTYAGLINNASYLSTYNITYDLKNSSQWIRTGGNIYYQNLTGSVGIGTTEPADRLTVADSINVFDSDAPYDTVIRLVSTNDDGRIDVYADNSVTTRIHGNGNSYFNGGNVGIGNTTPATTFQVGTNTLSVNATSGNVGIGTTVPDGKLHVLTATAGTMTASSVGDDFVIENSANTGMSLLTADTSYNRIYFGSPSDNDYAIIFAGYQSGVTDLSIVSKNGAITFDGASDELMRINTINGNVGIGTTAPSGLLHLNVSNDATNPIFRMERGVAGQVWGFHEDNNDFTIRDITNNVNRLTISDGTAATSNFNFNNGNGQVVFSGTGKVGIGTTSPAYSLMVNTSVSGISIYSLANVSASGYITRTDVFDKSKGKALDFIKDASAYKNIDGSINHSAFSYSGVKYDKTVVDKVTNYTIIDNICHDESYTEKECHEEDNITEIFNEVINETEQIIDKIQVCEDVLKTRQVCEDVPRIAQNTTYKTIKEEGVSLDKEIALLKQAVFELKTELDKVKTEVCTIKILSWCIK